MLYIHINIINGMITLVKLNDYHEAGSEKNSKMRNLSEASLKSPLGGFRELSAETGQTGNCICGKRRLKNRLHIPIAIQYL